MARPRAVPLGQGAHLSALPAGLWYERLFVRMSCRVIVVYAATCVLLSPLSFFSWVTLHGASSFPPRAREPIVDSPVSVYYIAVDTDPGFMDAPAQHQPVDWLRLRVRRVQCQEHRGGPAAGSQSLLAALLFKRPFFPLRPPPSSQRMSPLCNMLQLTLCEPLDSTSFADSAWMPR